MLEYPEWLLNGLTFQFFSRKKTKYSHFLNFARLLTSNWFEKVPQIELQK